MHNFKTTALNNSNVAVIDQSGRIGNVRYVQKGGLTYVRMATVRSMGNPRSSAQMTQRLKWRSLFNMAKALDLKKCYVKTNPNQSMFNLFMKKNQGTGVYFTKDQAAAMYQVAMPVMVAQGKGTIPEVTNTLNGTCIVSNLAIGSLAFSATTTVAEFSLAILNLNQNLQVGDMVSFISCVQASGTNFERVTENIYYVTLDLADTSLIKNHLTSDCLANVGGYLGTVDSAPAGCFGYMISRNDEDGFDVSKCILANNNATKIAFFTSDTQFALAAASYGESEDAWVDPQAHGGEEEYIYAISVSVSSTSPSGSGTVSGQGDYRYGAAAVITATPAEGYEFIQWNDGDTNATRVITVTEPKAFEATFAGKRYNLTVGVDSSCPTGGTVSPSGVSRHPQGEMVTLTATPAAGYSFGHWSDSVEQTSNPRQISMPGHDAEYLAIFEEE